MSKVNAFLFAERIIREAENQRTTVVGIFDEIDLDDLRQASTPWYIYILLVELPVGETELLLRIIRNDDGGREFHGRGVIQVAEEAPVPRKVECGLPIHTFNTRPGHYDVFLHLNGELVATRQLLVTKKEEQSDGGDPTED